MVVYRIVYDYNMYNIIIKYVIRGYRGKSKKVLYLLLPGIILGSDKGLKMGLSADIPWGRRVINRLSTKLSFY